MSKIQFRNAAHRDFVLEIWISAKSMTAITEHFLCDGDFRRNENEHRKDV